MAGKNPPKRMEKKPKKDAKLKAVSREPATPMVVEVVKRKRKERPTDDED